MEVGQQSIDDLELETRLDEEIGRAGGGDDRPSGSERDGLEGSHHGGADGDDAPASSTSRRDGGCRTGVDREALGLHPVVVEVVGRDRAKRAGSDVKRDLGDLDAGRFELGQELF